MGGPVPNPAGDALGRGLLYHGLTGLGNDAGDAQEAPGGPALGAAHGELQLEHPGQNPWSNPWHTRVGSGDLPVHRYVHPKQPAADGDQELQPLHTITTMKAMYAAQTQAADCLARIQDGAPPGSCTLSSSAATA